VGAFIAKANIPWGGVLAFSRGQRVEADAVKANGWEDLVVGENTKEAREIKAEVSGRPVADFEVSDGTTTTASRAAAQSGTE
jgi:hypothetical protein